MDDTVVLSRYNFGLGRATEMFVIFGEVTLQARAQLWEALATKREFRTLKIGGIYTLHDFHYSEKMLSILVQDGQREHYFVMSPECPVRSCSSGKL